jgi:hypothetical protein
MRRRIAFVLALSGVLMAAACAPPAPVAPPPAAAPVADAPRAKGGATFNPLDTGGPASTGSSGY